MTDGPSNQTIGASQDLERPDEHRGEVPQEIYSYRVTVSKAYWILMPILILVYPFVQKISGFDFEQDVYREYGLIENLTAVFLVIAVIVGVRLSLTQKKPINIFYSILTVGAFYFLGEEISWGQWLFSWDTPESFKEINTQNETNLHNLPGVYNDIFAKIPRFMLSVAAMVGGFLIPVWFLWKGKSFKLNSIHCWLWPSYICSVTAILANVVALPAKIMRNLDIEAGAYMDFSYGELKECFIALFICFYMLTSRKYFSAKGVQPDK